MIVIDLSTPEKMKAALVAMEAKADQRMARRLLPNQCICRNCGICEATGDIIIAKHHYKICPYGCTSDNGEALVVWTQSDFDEYLPNVSEADFEWLERNYRSLMAAMHERYNGEMAGVI